MKRVSGLWMAIWVAAGQIAVAEEPVTPVFSLGEVLVVGAEDSSNDGTTAQVTGAQAEQRGRATVADAAALAPGVTLTRIGGRNETAAYVRGFDTRQVPLFIDGIPVYVPYDGNVDMGRFNVFDMAEMSISKGYSPVIFGPNTLGGDDQRGEPATDETGGIRGAGGGLQRRGLRRRLARRIAAGRLVCAGGNLVPRARPF